MQTPWLRQGLLRPYLLGFWLPLRGALMLDQPLLQIVHGRAPERALIGR
jgi:hypothetical protein